MGVSDRRFGGRFTYVHNHLGSGVWQHTKGWRWGWNGPVLVTRMYA